MLVHALKQTDTFSGPTASTAVARAEAISGRSALRECRRRWSGQPMGRSPDKGGMMRG